MIEVEKAIDPARPGIGKGLLWATGSFGCERASFYGERVRDQEGRRLSFPMPERVHFGKAIDVLHGAVMRRLRDLSGLDRAGFDLDAVIDLAYYAGLDGEWSEDRDDETFRIQVENAGRKLMGLVENPTPKDRPAPDGPPAFWLPMSGMKIQGFDGQSIEVPGVFGDRPLVATPDYLWVDDAGTIISWLDVKATDRSFTYPDKWIQAEAATYTLACTLHNGGEVPQRIGYMEYRRVAKPYWTVTWTEGVASLSRIGSAFVNRWAKALTLDDPDLVAFNTSRCGECEFARPISEVGFSGCPIGAVLPHKSEGAEE